MLWTSLRSYPSTCCDISIKRWDSYCWALPPSLPPSLPRLQIRIVHHQRPLAANECCPSPWSSGSFTPFLLLLYLANTPSSPNQFCMFREGIQNEWSGQQRRFKMSDLVNERSSLVRDSHLLYWHFTHPHLHTFEAVFAPPTPPHLHTRTLVTHFSPSK